MPKRLERRVQKLEQHQQAARGVRFFWQPDARTQAEIDELETAGWTCVIFRWVKMDEGQHDE
jgi:hypothetical protein